MFTKRLAIAVLVAATMAEAGRDVAGLNPKLTGLHYKMAKAQTHLRVESQTTEHNVELWFLKVLRLTK